MLVKLDDVVRSILCCPICKGSLEGTDSQFSCISCSMVYPIQTAGKGSGQEHVCDFRIRPPVYCTSVVAAKWLEIQ
jgi:hypothetical protein